MVDLGGGGRVVTGPRVRPVICEADRWGHGVTVALTPAGVPAVLGVPLREITERTVALEDLLGAAAGAELAERLAVSGRFAALDSWLLDRIGSSDIPNLSGGLVAAAWWRLQGLGPKTRAPESAKPEQARPGAAAGDERVRVGAAAGDGRVRVGAAAGNGRIRVGAAGNGRVRVGAVAAALGVGRRRLESEFRREIGLTPVAVARIARFQRATNSLAAGTELHRVAADTGYADQPHLTREVRAMSGLTPAVLRATLRSALGRAPDQKHGRAPDQNHGRAPDQKHGRAPDQDHGRASDTVRSRASVQDRSAPEP
ncbi:helix-turn-helix domain-containing protein [Actinoplanes sp. DH11]|uniref:AraC family transcriptional regulator n=1 Tax=Actinoplanes sp. DH11 TaxID=2857011 RepID=UPI0027DEB243|nr:helix-turn-helix domain-containing protein [Actinoplanes sp. DH11]